MKPTRQQALEAALTAFAATFGLPSNQDTTTNALVLDHYNGWRIEQVLATGGRGTPFGCTRYSSKELERMMWFAVTAFTVRNRKVVHRARSTKERL